MSSNTIVGRSVIEGPLMGYLYGTRLDLFLNELSKLQIISGFSFRVKGEVVAGFTLQKALDKDQEPEVNWTEIYQGFERISDAMLQDEDYLNVAFKMYQLSYILAKKGYIKEDL